MDIVNICVSPFAFLKCASSLINLEYKIMIEEKLFPNSKDPNIRCKMETAMKVLAMVCKYVACPMEKRNFGTRDCYKYSKRFESNKSHTICKLESSIKKNKKDLNLLVLKYFLESDHSPNKKLTLKEISNREHHPFFFRESIRFERNKVYCSV